ncbi:GNAT family N-acetyltransferase [Bacillus cereus]|uniref:GNAT family N-acetyltransferase n=1 Tax=Bacillus mycoides TaxID=1405 RepID=UPI000BFA1DC8|nr:GNAT family N-acetyltransferase [Bacillus mycoides]PES74603.1 GNAT family N-acetyltransferase [Bacillus cereus]PET03911.1 GNAT family N-acetyltransferase [Bacillus cereus]PFF33690.1 GNAT family N-acetyltransferase [Bacillus cereus]PFI44329.1 GNAT family N-acetyltransferase [Bacillus cereus]QWI41115.1 GNAT family N-acetyltransferase [Bacillus mycoides]
MIELRELTTNDGTDVFEMIQEIGKGQNGFVNSLYSDNFSLFQEKLLRNYEMSEGINLEPQYVPQTIYWLYVDGKPVGYGKLRHYLNQNLLQHGGHIGYVIGPISRGNGYAKILLKELLQKSREKGIDQVLLTCDDSNTASRKVIESNNGELKDIKDGSCFYWISIN